MQVSPSRPSTWQPASQPAQSTAVLAPIHAASRPLCASSCAGVAQRQPPSRQPPARNPMPGKYAGFPAAPITNGNILLGSTPASVRRHHGNPARVKAAAQSLLQCYTDYICSPTSTRLAKSCAMAFASAYSRRLSASPVTNSVYCSSYLTPAGKTERLLGVCPAAGNCSAAQPVDTNWFRFRQ